MSDLKTKITALIAVVELTENKVGLETLKEIQEDIRWIPIDEDHPGINQIIECKKEDKVYFTGIIKMEAIEKVNRLFVEDMFSGTAKIDLVLNFTHWRSIL